MRKFIPLIMALAIVSIVSLIVKAQTPQPNPKNVELAHRFSYILDNGFEKIDLEKVPDIDKYFFNLGTAQLIIYDKNDSRKKNLLNSFTLIVEPTNNKVMSDKVFTMNSPTFTTACKQYVTGLAARSKITFAEVRLNITLPQTTPQAPGSKHTVPTGMLPVAFFLYIK